MKEKTKDFTSTFWLESERRKEGKKGRKRKKGRKEGKGRKDIKLGRKKE